MADAAKSHWAGYKDFPDAPADYREAALGASLQQLFQAAIAHAEGRITWYGDKAGERAGWAKRIRWWSLCFFAAGTLAPVVLTFLVKVAGVLGKGGREPAKWDWPDWLAAVPLAEVGYVLLAMAGALVIFDQFFDASGSWIRFRQSQARLEVLLAQFRYSWAEMMTKCGGIVTAGTAVDFVQLLREFVTKIELVAEEETKEWARRFSQRIDAFDRNPNLKVTLGGNAGKPADTPEDHKQQETAGSASQQTQAAAAAAAQRQATTVTVRLWVEDFAALDAGSLQLTVNDSPIDAVSSGARELPLEIGQRHRVAGAARRNGQAVNGEIEITPTLDDEGRLLELTLR